MTKEERREYSIKVIERVMKDANINMSLDEFVATYASNRGIANDPINVARNIEKYQLGFEGNFKYLYNILGDKMNFMKESPKYYRFDSAQYRASRKYEKTNLIRLVVKLNKNTDQDIIEHLDSIENKQGYIKELIRHDISHNR